ncbi:DNA-binding HTH domain-containing proteins [Moorella thermoacetica Y72]|uniref:DNA-binding HTH domain-containing proteins n=1 Tax=Moorella thermoacetica Y72 TaxID=1325331 RepID=A0A0S6UAE1_NEOTH|nr:DNA-binding HTH domain-containing proteins [Moorella thermoacetica Y72]
MVPLTTRPWSTSRQGIILLVNNLYRLFSLALQKANSPRPLISICGYGQGFFQGEIAVVQGATQDGPFHSLGCQFLELPEVVQAGNTPGGNDLQAAAARHLPGGGNVGPLEGAVAADVGKNGPRDPQGRHLPGKLHCSPGYRSFPALNGHLAIKAVNTDNHPFAITFHRRGHYFRVGNGYRPQDHPGGPGCQDTRQAFQAADTAAHLDRHPGGPDNGCNNLQVPRPAGKGAVQVHHMEPAGAPFHPAPGNGHRVRGIDGLGFDTSLVEAHAAPLPQINGRHYQHGAPTPRNSLKPPGPGGCSSPGETGPRRGCPSGC